MSSVNINAYLHVRKANNPVYHPNGERLTFLTDYTGLPQVWELNRGEGWPSQISYTDERIMFVQYITGTTKRIVGMDEGVNERQQLFLLEDDGEMIPLTDSPDHIHHYGGSSPDGKFIAWASNRREHAFFDLYIQNLDTLEFRRVFSGNGNFKVLKWHPSGKQLLIEKTNASLDNDLGLLDLEIGEGHWFTLHDGEALFQSPQFSRDGRLLYVLTNKDHEYLSLAAIDVHTNSWTWLDEKGWDLEGLTMSPDKTKLAYTVNEGGKSKGVILDIDRHSFQLWETPPGTISDLTFSPDGAKLAYVFNGATHPADIWELAITSNRSERITYVSQSPAVEKELVEPELIHFTSFDGLEVPAFYYKPKNVFHGEKFPVVVFVHGGPESQIRSVYNPFLQYFLNRGYAVCTPNVRGSTGYGKTYTHLDDVRKRMDSVKDLTALVDWLTTEGDAAPDKIAIMGRSYGGFMVLAAITHYPKLWSAAIDIVGISSFRTFLENTSSWRRKLRESEYGSIEEDGDFFDEIDPLHRTDQITCPVMVLHGANDPRVPIEETEQIVDDLKGRNHPVTYIRFEDEGHFFVKLKNNITAYTGVADFLDNYIGK